MASRRPWLSSLAVVLAVVMVAEVAVRSLESQLPTVRAGDAAEMIIKARQIDALAAEGDGQVDLVVFGTSMMDSATSPSIVLANSTRFDSAYNASVVGAPLATQVRWADEIVLRRLEPDVIVLGVHPVDLLLTDVLNLNIKPDQADTVFSRVLRETRNDPIAAIDRLSHDHVALVRQRGALRRPRTMWDATLRAVTGQDPPGSLALRDEAFWFEHLTPLGESSQFHGDPFGITAAGEQLRAKFEPSGFTTTDLRRLLDVVTATDAQVVVVVPPVPVEAWREVGVDLEALATGVRIISDLADEYGAPVLDFSTSGYPNAQFADVLHSNDQGASRFSADLVAQLETLGLDDPS